LRFSHLAAFILSFAIGATAGTTTLQTNTTLAAETANNTSASANFAGQSNGNIAATNISKLPIRSLLYPGSTTKIYAHLMPWFGSQGHVSVGYDSSDSAQEARQVDDMASRGIDGAIVDWYGPNSTHHNTATKYALKAAELHPNFELAICEDWGAVKNSTNPTQQTISDLNYAWQSFMQSKSYMRQDGRPVIFFFGFEGQNVDIAAIKSALTFNPVFVFRNSGGFTKSMSDGGFSWLDPMTSGYDSYMSLPYLDNFYTTGLKYPVQAMYGSGFKGFNDTIASWAPPGGRHVPQFCGQTWLKSFQEAGRYFSADNQLPALQIVTWNDYEEGTAIEPGIDNCVSITSWMSASRLNWSITGDESTVDHYTIFASLDGTNLATVGNFEAGTTGVELNELGLSAADYQFYVKAVGKASMANHMSSAVAYSFTANTASPDYAMTLAPLSVQMARGGSATMTIGVNPVNSSFTSPVALSCGNLPASMQCSFSKASLVPGASGASTVLTIMSAPSTTGHSSNPFGWAVLPAFGFVFVLGSGVCKRTKQVASVAVLLLLVALGMGCGGGSAKQGTVVSSADTVASAGTYRITISAVSGNRTKTTQATVTVQ
jgi:hypothetical protein